MGGVRDTERFKGLWCVWPERTEKKIKSKRLFPPRGPGCSRVPRKKLNEIIKCVVVGHGASLMASRCPRLPEPYPELSALPPRKQRGWEYLQRDGVTRATSGCLRKGVAWVASLGKKKPQTSSSGGFPRCGVMYRQQT